ncbi:MAG: hypothetical protein O6947_08905 [Acidobacteria bacterium]|nr:hypothetical protein [Acidobacteriota bacterium]
MKIGEYFIQKGIITEDQLNDALRAQLIYGGHLGTCLMELGYLEENALGHALAEIYQVLYANPDLFVDIPQSIIQTLPARVVERLHVVPFDLRGKDLHVAMMNPKDLPSLDEISFASGYETKPWVTPEARIFQVIERYYDIPKRQRYINVCRDLDHNQSELNRGMDGEGLSQEKEPNQEPTPQLRAILDPSNKVATLPHRDPADSEMGAIGSPPVTEENHRIPLPNRTKPDAVPGKPDDEISNLMCGADTLKDLADVVLDYTSRQMERCILFSVKSDHAVLWGSRGIALNQDNGRHIRIPICEAPIFQLLLGEDHFRGALPDNPLLHGFYESLGMAIPAEVLMIPVHFMDRLVAIFYGDGGLSSGIRGQTQDYRTLLQKLTLAFNLVRIKEKIRSL